MNAALIPPATSDLDLQSCEFVAYLVTDSVSNLDLDSEPFAEDHKTGLDMDQEIILKGSTIRANKAQSINQPSQDDVDYSIHFHVCCLPSWDTASGDLGLGGDHQKGSPVAVPTLLWADSHSVKPYDTVCQALPDKAGHFAYQEDKETADDEISERKEVDIADFGLGL